MITRRWLLILALCLCAFAPGAQSHNSRWQTLAEPVRVTFYGPQYRAGDVTKSGIRYAPDADIVALGPELLASVRAHYRQGAEKIERPLFWRWMPGPKLQYQGVAGGFPRHACFACQPEWWGYFVQVCDVETDHCELLRVADTGLESLEVDLPDQTWACYGHAAETGVFQGRLEVLSLDVW